MGIHSKRVHFDSRSRLDKSAETYSYSVKLPVKLKNIVAARLVSAEFDQSNASTSFIDIELGSNTIKMTMCHLTVDRPLVVPENTITTTLTLPPGSYSLEEFKTELSTQMNTAFSNFDGNAGNFVTTTISLDSEYHLKFTFSPLAVSTLYGIRFKVHTASNYSETAYADSLPSKLGFEFDTNDTSDSALLGRSDFIATGTQPISPVNYVDIVGGVNDTIRTGVALTVGGGVALENLFDATVTIPAGRYETSILLKEIEDQLNSKRVYDFSSGSAAYAGGGYDFRGIDYNGTTIDYGQIQFRLTTNFTTGEIAFEFYENMSYKCDALFAKVFCGTDLFPTQADFDNSLPAMLGFAYKPLENAGTIYDNTLYQTDYDFSGRYGTITPDALPTISFSPFTTNVTNEDDIVIIDGKNTFEIGLAFMYNGVEKPISASNTWISKVAVQPGTYNITELGRYVELSLGSIRRYLPGAPIAQSNYVAGGYDFNLKDFGYSDYSSTTPDVSFDPDSKKFTIKFTDNLVNFPLGDVTNVYVGIYCGAEEYLTLGDYENSLPYFLGIPYDPSFVKSVDEFDPKYYQNNVITAGSVWQYTGEEIQYAYNPNTTIPISLSLGFSEFSPDSTPTMIKIDRTITKKQYTFGEVKSLVDGMIENDVVYLTGNLIDPEVSGLNRISGSSSNRAVGELMYDEATNRAKIRIGLYLNQKIFGGNYGYIYLKLHLGTDLYPTQADFDQSIPSALGFEYNPADDGSEFGREFSPASIETYSAIEEELYDFKLASSTTYLSLGHGLDETKLTGDVSNRNNTNEVFAKILLPTSSATIEPFHLETVRYDHAIDLLDTVLVNWFQISPVDVHEKFTENLEGREHSFTIEFDVLQDNAVAQYDQNFIRTARF